VADLGAHAGGGDDHLAAAARHRGVHERHVEPVAQPYVLLSDGVRVFERRHALAGQGRFFDLERSGYDEAPVGWDPIAGFEQHDVARH